LHHGVLVDDVVLDLATALVDALVADEVAAWSLGT